MREMESSSVMRRSLNRPRAPVGLRFLGALTLMVAPAVPALCQTDVASSSDELRVRRGERLYRVHCAGCHGATGRGSGEMAEILRVAPADLTALAAREDDGFPRERVRASIDGRYEIRGHGRRAMPVWGLVFSSSDKVAEQEVDVEAAIDALLSYLMTIQESDSARD